MVPVWRGLSENNVNTNNSIYLDVFSSAVMTTFPQGLAQTLPGGRIGDVVVSLQPCMHHAIQE